MATIPQFDPLTTEATSPFLAGLSEGLSRIALILNLTTTTITDSAMSEVYIGEDDRYRIYQVEAGSRLWLSDPAPVVKKNGSVITPVGANFTIDYIGGSIKFESIARLTSGDTVTVSATRINNASTEIEDIKTDVTALEAITANFLGYYSSVSALSTAHATGSDGNFAIIGGTVDSIYMWDSTGSAWKDIYKTVDLSTYYTKTEADALLSAKEASITAHGSTTASDLYYYGGRKTWQELAARVRASVLTGIDTATSAVITATDTVLSGLGKLQAQITGKPFINGTGDPTTATVGTIGQRYVNTSTGAAFRCTTIVGETYTWVKQGTTDDLVDSNVTNAKLANIANNTIKGNVSGSAAAPSDLTVAQVRGIITEGTSEVDSIADGDKFVIEDVSATAGVRTKHVLWSAIKTALASVFAGITHASRHLIGGADALNAMPYDATSTNLLINGGFDIWQRGTSQNSSGFGSDDRWANINDVSTKTHSRQAFAAGQTDVPNNPNYYSRTVVSSGGTAASRCIKYYKFEDVTKLSGKTVTLSFWAKSDSARSVSVEFQQNFGTGGSTGINAIGVQKFTLSTIWAMYTATVTFPSVSGKTIGSNNLSTIVFWFDAGSDYNARTDSLGNQSGTFDIANVQLNYGSVALPFVPRSFADELRLCQRYYIGKIADLYATAYTAIGLTGFTFPVEMRAVPTVTIYDYTGTTANTVSLAGVGTALSVSSVDSTRAGVTSINTASTTVKNIYRFMYVADIEL